MADARRAADLASRFGLRNVHADWLRQNSQYSLEHLVDPIARRDLCAISSGTLPFAVADAHDVALAAPALVQLEDAVNIAGDDPRSRAAPCTLLLRLTDGRQSFAAVELIPLGGRIGVKTTPGTKLRLREGALFRRGRLMLTPDAFDLVGRSPPSANVWGADYDARCAARLRDAGLRAPDAVSFDVLAQQPAGPDNTRSLTSLGGIADLPEDDQEEDDAFWVQAMAAENSMVTQARSATPREDAAPPQQSTS